MAQKKHKHKHHPKPTGQTYADKLARDRLVKQAVEKAAVDETVRFHADIKSQRIMWLLITSIAEYWGAGPQRMMGNLDVFADHIAEFDDLAEKHGMEYALEKLRQRVQKVTGLPIEYLYEKEILDAKKRNEAKGIYLTVLDEEIV